MGGLAVRGKPGGRARAELRSQQLAVCRTYSANDRSALPGQYQLRTAEGRIGTFGPPQSAMIVTVLRPFVCGRRS